jgi:hypothetical protein
VSVADVSGRAGHAYERGLAREPDWSIVLRLGHGALPCCAGDDVEAESASLRVDRPVYPRRV